MIPIQIIAFTVAMGYSIVMGSLKAHEEISYLNNKDMTIFENQTDRGPRKYETNYFGNKIVNGLSILFSVIISFLFAFLYSYYYCIAVLLYIFMIMIIVA